VGGIANPMEDPFISIIILPSMFTVCLGLLSRTLVDSGINGWPVLVFLLYCGLDFITSMVPERLSALISHPTCAIISQVIGTSTLIPPLTQ